MRAVRGLAYEHVVFDLDGTLVDSRRDLAASLNHLLAVLERPALPPERVAAYVGEGARRLVERALATEDPDLVARGLAIFLEHYAAHLLDATRPYPGIVEVVDALVARGAVLSVLSNKPEQLSRAIVDGLGLGSRFVGVVGGDSLPTRKPDPAGMQHLCRLAGVAAERTLLVGDSGVDVRTARAAGTGFCGVSWGLTPDGLRAADPDRVIDRPADLLAIVERG